MSYASNVGYSNINPISNSNYINTTSSNNPAFFGSIETSRGFGMSGASNNADAAAGIVPGLCFTGGSVPHIKRKIKNISRKYKRMSRRTMKRTKRRLSKFASKHRRRRHSMRGGTHVPAYPAGYGQYQNNMPITPSYSTGGVLDPSESALANPVPFKVFRGGRRKKCGKKHRRTVKGGSGCPNCLDNYNHFENMGFYSRGN
jgi:hypothetical protein